MMSAKWLNEFRFGWSSIKFLMTPIDYLTNPAQAVALPNINLNDAGTYTTVGNAAAGTISAMLSSPSCSLCGTTERQVQLALKVRF
jgi:hypothetical protein